MKEHIQVPSIPVVFILFFIASKELFSYDGERVVIFCILTFVILAYYQLRSGLNLMLKLRTAKIQEEFASVVNLKIKLEKLTKEF